MVKHLGQHSLGKVKIWEENINVDHREIVYANGAGLRLYLVSTLVLAV
jgi:hypothetical protein